MTGTLKLTEDDVYFFDAVAAERPVKFIERYCRHYTGRFAGQPFILHAIQKKIVRDLFGWKTRATGYRRFTDCYFEGAVGSGKSPLLSAIGLYGLIADNEPGAQVFSFASTYTQANIVFDCAKKFVRNHRELERRIDPMQFEIRHPQSNSTWKIVSKNGPGAGCNPSMIIGDECHQWPHSGAYKDLRDRMAKRQQPLTIIATNAGTSRASFCWQLREKAVAALAGFGDPSLYPIIWAAGDDAQTDDPLAWQAANPLLGTTIEVAKVRAKAAEAIKDPVEEAEFRQLCLGIWPTTTATRWLDLADFDACASPAAPPEDAPLYVGMDLSQVDDLSAVAWVYVAADRFYLDAHFWLPRATAEKYAEEGIPYLDWAKAGHITLVDEPTISAAVKMRIAAAIIARGKGKHPLKAVCFDRYKADDAVAAIEAAGLICVPVAQGYSLSPGCQELERRLKERSAAISRNPVLRFCAENCEIKQDDRGNYWPVKPNAKGRFAGTRAKKIDGIAALVTALTEARKHAFPPARKMFQGTICKL